MDVRTVVNEILPGFQDDLLEFIVSAVEDMTIEEKKSIQSIQELISPFLLDTGNFNENIYMNVDDIIAAMNPLRCIWLGDHCDFQASFAFLVTAPSLELL